MRSRRHAFAFIEVIIVLAIILVLSAFLLGMFNRRPNFNGQAAITLELQQLAGAIEDLKNEYGAYPPNSLVNSVDVDSGNPIVSPGTDLRRMLKKAFPRHKEPESLLLTLVGESDESDNETTLVGGITPSEAVFFWLGGFSEDPKYPISSAGGPSFCDAEGNRDGVLNSEDEKLTSRNMRYDFDMRRLNPQTAQGIFDDRGSAQPKGRHVEYNDPRDGTRRRINFWRYLPEYSEVAIEYFDASRYTASEYYPAIHPQAVSNVGPLMQRSDKANPESAAREDLKYVQQGRFQLLHAGFDGEWGDWSAIRSGAIIAPQGPFQSDIADTLAHFRDGTFEDMQE